jgi:hypothetical protein
VEKADQKAAAKAKESNKAEAKDKKGQKKK